MHDRTTDMHPRPSGAELQPTRLGGGSTRASTRATTAGTRRVVARDPATREDFRRPFPRRLTVGALGAGTYLGECTDDDDAAYARTLRAAVALGINLVDTASNYRCQRSERTVGRTLDALFESDEARRDELIVCTKGGYLAFDAAPPPSRVAYEAWREATLFATGILTQDELVRGGHSIAPSFLAHQLAQSRANLRLPTIDVYYLHNPEEQLLGVDRGQFRDRLRAAFTFLEEAAERGEIVSYGCATWLGLRVGPEHRQHLTLADLVAVAREVAGTSHHFRLVQLPLSLAMPEAARVPTQPLGRRMVTLLEAADALGIGVVASAPLMQGRLATGLPDEVRELFPECATDAQRALRFATSLPGVASALAGMRHGAHLEENLGAWQRRA
jgi:aryl-alcohol dehydrogenase-like predicted oxidoreductase